MFVEENLTGHNGLLITELIPAYHIKGKYNFLNTRLVEVFNNGGSVTNSNGLYNIIGGTNIYEYGVLRSVRQLNPQSGSSIVHRFNCIFDTGTSLYWQLAGAGVSGNGLFFGYNQTAFSILRQSGGVGEVRRLEITTAETSTSTTAVITLNGTTFNVSLTTAAGATGLTKEFTAYQIAETTFAGWSVTSIGAFVYFSADSTGLKDGLSYSYANGGGNSAGTITQITPGATETYTWVPQTSWNVDKMDGKGKSKMTLNPLFGNNYQIRYEQDFGVIEYYVENSRLGNYQLVHRVLNGNISTSVTLDRVAFKSLFAVYSIGGDGTVLTMRVGYFSAMVEGFDNIDNVIWGTSDEKNILANTETNILVLKSKSLQNGIINSSDMLLGNLSVASDGTKNVIIKIYNNSTVGNNLVTDFHNFTSANVNSIASTDIKSTTQTGGILIASFNLAKIDSFTTELLKGLSLQRLENVVVTAKSTGASIITASLNWREDY
tara:strand:+ start:5037 stop:6506 length:1470 start_codon:yes stop_codon:yes gene_type:complete